MATLIIIHEQQHVGRVFMVPAFPCYSFLKAQTREPDNRYITINLDAMGNNSVAHLPLAYTNIPQITLSKDNIDVPPLPVNLPLRPDIRPLANTLKDMYEWLANAHDLLDDKTVDFGTKKWISWAAYYANKIGPPLSRFHQ